MSVRDAQYCGKRKHTRRELFLAEMRGALPWKSPLDLIESFYPVASGGCQPYPLDTVLRAHLMQDWFALSSPAMEEALYEFTLTRRFARRSLTKPISDETTILDLRHGKEQGVHADAGYAGVQTHVRRKGLRLEIAAAPKR